MVIREYIENDFEKVKEFVERNNLSFPTEGRIILAEDDNGEIKSFVNIRMVMFVEPMISENPLMSKNLWDYVEERIKEKKIKIIRCFSEEKNIELFGKLGFYKVFGDKTALEKNYYSEV